MRILVLILIFFAAAASAQELALPFGNPEEGLGENWYEQTFRATAPTVYRLLREGDMVILEATSSNQGSGLIHEIDLDLATYPLLTWRWQISGVIPTANALTKEGDDYPARIYVVFPHWFKPRTRSINYIWANRLKQGQVVPNPFFSNARMVAVQSGDVKAKTWVTECRNVYQDYRAIFGSNPPVAGAIALMTDTDNTGGQARARYADIRLIAAPTDADPAAYCP